KPITEIADRRRTQVRTNRLMTTSMRAWVACEGYLARGSRTSELRHVPWLAARYDEVLVQACHAGRDESRHYGGSAPRGMKHELLLLPPHYLPGHRARVRPIAPDLDAADPDAVDAGGIAVRLLERRFFLHRLGSEEDQVGNVAGTYEAAV